jgi:succinyl-CoA synthetase beta subunit
VNIHEYQGKEVLRKYGVTTPRGFPCFSPDDPTTGLKVTEADDVARKIGIPEKSIPEARAFMQNLYRAFDECDASLAEINPLVLTGDARVIALDAKFNFDSNALFRHPEIVAMRDLDEEDPAEIEASTFDLAYISLDGNIGCLVNGAGLAMATMDVIKLYGGSPANFLDVGGGATTEKVTEAFKLMLRNPNLQAILVNIFGGIMKCDVIAHGVVAAARQVDLTVPLVVRMKGTNEELGRTVVGIGGDPVGGLKHIDVLKMFNDDPGTDAVVMVGEIGGDAEETCARWIKDRMRKPVVGFFAGVTAPPGKRMGHAGAIISGGKGTAQEKLSVMQECGIHVTRNPAEMGKLLASLIEHRFTET